MSLSLNQPLKDLRQQQLEQWLQQQLGVDLEGDAAGSDAGFRRYFRYQHKGRSLVAMDAPPATEDCRPFLQVAGLLKSAGVIVPEIIAEDVERGFLLLSDLGAQTCLEYINSNDLSYQQAQPLFEQAISALIKFQQVSQTGVLPAYDETLLRRELELFPEWYLQRELGVIIDKPLRVLLDKVFDQLLKQILAQPKGYVHRDFMLRNLMVNNRDDSGIGVLDFQDAVYGPLSYDIASLFKDAFISWPESWVEAMTEQYWQQALAAGIAVPAAFEDFQRDCAVMVSQRHLKVIGIFARICHRDGKPHYLADVDRFFGYLSTAAQRWPELSALAELLVYLDDRKLRR